MDKPTLVLAGGGTAGHVNPLLATASELCEDADLLCLGTREGLEAELLPKAGFSLTPVDKIPLPRKPSLDLLRLPRRMHRQVVSLRNLFRDKHVAGVVGFGGYVSTPAYIAAHKENIPIIIHEQNARPGLANRVGARWAKACALTFSSTSLHATHGITRTIGLPLRRPIRDLAIERTDHEKAFARRVRSCETYGLDPARPIVVVTGGSLGALHINRSVAQASHYVSADIQFIHLSGKGKSEEVRAIVKGREGYVVHEYVVDMENVLATADVVVCRSGAGTVAELSALGIPAIYVPLPIGNGEQRLNAADAVHAGGARIVMDKEFSAQRAEEEITSVIGDQKTRQRMAQAAASCGYIDAAGQLAAMVKEVAGL